jgi:hypothetical protein
MDISFVLDAVSPETILLVLKCVWSYLILSLFPELESTCDLQEDHHLDLPEDLLLPILIGELLSHLHSLPTLIYCVHPLPHMYRPH